MLLFNMSVAVSRRAAGEGVTYNLQLGVDEFVADHVGQD